MPGGRRLLVQVTTSRKSATPRSTPGCRLVNYPTFAVRVIRRVWFPPPPSTMGKQTDTFVMRRVGDAQSGEDAGTAP